MIKVIKRYDVHGKRCGTKVYVFGVLIYKSEPELYTTLK